MAGKEYKIPLAREQATIGRRVVETGRVRIGIVTEEEQVKVPLDLAETELVVEHVPVGRYVEEPPPVRREGDATIIPVLEERAVVTVRLWLREEVRIRPVTARHAQDSTVVLRSQKATVERLAPGQGAAPHETKEQ